MAATVALRTPLYSEDRVASNIAATLSIGLLLLGRMSIYTSRLQLKAITVDDAEFYLALMNCHTWLEFIGDRNVYTVDEARSYIERTMQKQWTELGYGNFIVFKQVPQDPGGDVTDSFSQIPIGAVGLFSRYSKVDLGFAFLPEYEKLGYAYEAATALLHEARVTYNITTLSGITTSNNINCQKLLSKLGFHLKEETVLPNETRPVLLYEKLL